MYHLAVIVGGLILACCFTANGVQTKDDKSGVRAQSKGEVHEKVLYLIAGCPTHTRDLHFPTTLYTIGKDAFEQVRVVVAGDRGTWFVHPYYDERAVVVGEALFRRKDILTFVLINMNSPAVLSSIELSYCHGCSVLQCHLFDLKRGGLNLGCKIAGGGQQSELLGRKVMGGVQEVLQWDVYALTVVSGMPGGGESGGDYLYVATDENGRLIVPIDKGMSIAMAWKLPNSYNVAPKDSLLMCVNNHDVLAVIAASRQRTESSGMGESTYYVYRKKDGEWDAIGVEGARTYLRGFGEWLTGYVADGERPTPSPGQEARRKEISSTGIPADWQFKDARMYSAGILFLYNAYTRRKILIRTDQGDSEVLLVDGETIYYRVNESLFKAQIGRNSIENIVLLKNSGLVADIHWAFMGPRIPRKGDN